MPGDLHRESGPAGVPHRPAHRGHRGVGQGEAVGVQDGLVPHDQHAHSLRCIHPCAPFGRRGDGREQAVVMRARKPALHGVRPGRGVPHRVTGGDRHLTHHPERHAGAAVHGEDRDLVATGREVPQGVLVTVLREQRAHRDLVPGPPRRRTGGRAQEDQHREHDRQGQQHGGHFGEPRRDRAVEVSPGARPAEAAHEGLGEDVPVVDRGVRRRQQRGVCGHDR